MPQGSVKKLTEKGFGFLSVEGGGKDVFFHASALQDAEFANLREGDRVEFEIEESDKGPRAVGVTLTA